MKKILATLVAGAGALALGSIASASTLTVEAAPPGIQQSQQGPCIIGETSGSCDVLLTNDADQSAYSLEYTVAQILGFVGNNFGVGIDVNEASGQPVQIMDLFRMEVSTNGGTTWNIVDTTTMAWELDDSVNNGNGISDLIIKTFNLSAYDDDDLVRFYVELSGLTDGKEQFLLLNLGNIDVPLPAAIWLMGAGLAGLGFAGRKKKKA